MYSIPADLRDLKDLRSVLKKMSRSGLLVYELFLFEIELRAILIRRLNPRLVLEMVAEELEIPLEAVYEALRFASEALKRVTVVAEAPSWREHIQEAIALLKKVGVD